MFWAVPAYLNDMRQIAGENFLNCTQARSQAVNLRLQTSQIFTRLSRTSIEGVQILLQLCLNTIGQICEDFGNALIEENTMSWEMLDYPAALHAGAAVPFSLSARAASQNLKALCR